MLEKKNWLLLFIQKFREILETEEYRGYREFFQAFCKDLYPYLSVELLEFYDKQGNHVRNEISLFSSDYGDKVEIVKKKDSFWQILFTSLLYSANEFVELYEKSNDKSINGILAFQKYYNDRKDLLLNFSTKDYWNTINLRNDFLDQDPVKLIKKLIDKEILSKLKVLTTNHQYQRAINRISLLKDNEVEDIIEFLDSDWSKINDSSKCEQFTKIFYLLGFEVIPIESLLAHRKFKEFNNLSHPELIAYDLNSNYILLFEELTKFSKEFLFKKDSVQSIIAKFTNYFYLENRKVDYLIIAEKEISINLNHYKYQYRFIQKDTFVKILQKVFNTELNQIDCSQNVQFKVEIKKLIDLIKVVNLLNIE